jgi:hypothetical protein
MESRDEIWKARFIEGKWGKGGGSIHQVLPESELEVDDEFLKKLLRRANLYRAFDHGGTTPACCLWIASCDNCYFVYREYYVADRIISDHRRSIQELSKDEEYVIFIKKQQNRGGFWCIADEYADSSITDSEPIYWAPADNNEFATRNRISELLRPHKEITHPITGVKGAPKLYFIKRSPTYAHGCYQAIRETRAQKYVLLDTVNGRPIFGDERNANISDHAYDCLRYFCAIHANFPKERPRKPPANSFLGQVRRLKALKKVNYFSNFARN